MSILDLWVLLRDAYDRWGWLGGIGVLVLSLCYLCFKFWRSKHKRRRADPGDIPEKNVPVASSDNSHAPDDIRLSPAAFATVINMTRDGGGRTPADSSTPDSPVDPVAALSNQFDVQQKSQERGLTNLEEKADQKTRQPEQFKTILKDVEALQERLKKDEADDQEGSAAIRDLRSQAAQALETGEFERAEQYLTEAEQSTQQQNQQAVAAIRAERAGLRNIQLDYSGAAALWGSAADLRDAEDVTTAGYCNKAGLAWMAAGQYARAEPLFERALKIDEEHRGPDHPETGESLNNLGLLYHETGRPEEAEPLYKRSLAILEEHLAPDHPATATALNNLAGLYQNTGRLKKAKPLLERALKIREKVFGPDHPETATPLNNLARLYQNMGRFKEAESLLERALKICENTLGPDHPNTATSLNNLAAVYQDMGRLKEAESLLERALKICENTLGPDHPNTRLVRNNLESLKNP